ncbi:MAG: hypothetical protein ABI720_09845 [Actinomycetes bacterium]
MSKRRPKSRPKGPLPSSDATVDWRGEPWVVRPIRGSSSTKSYRCPGCDQLIPPATPHTVVWPETAIVGDGAESRRHWHTTCWNARDRRGPR